MGEGHGSSDEDTALAAARGGDTAAFSKLVREHQGRVRAYVAGYIRDPVVADDVSQEAFVEAYRNLAKFRGNVPFAHWVLSIARNRAIDHARRELRRREREGPSWATTLVDWTLSASDDGPSEVQLRERELRALQTCLEQLPPPTAALLHDHYGRGRRAVDIAGERGVSPSAVRMTLLRVRAALRACIEGRLRQVGDAG